MELLNPKSTRIYPLLTPISWAGGSLMQAPVLLRLIGPAVTIMARCGVTRSGWLAMTAVLFSSMVLMIMLT